jgi:hypothetical protein
MNLQKNIGLHIFRTVRRIRSFFSLFATNCTAFFYDLAHRFEPKYTYLYVLGF